MCRQKTVEPKAKVSWALPEAQNCEGHRLEASIATHAQEHPSPDFFHSFPAPVKRLVLVDVPI